MSVVWLDSENSRGRRAVQIKSSIAFSDNQAVDLHKRSKPQIWTSTTTTGAAVEERKFIPVKMELSQVGQVLSPSVPVLSAARQIDLDVLSADELRKIDKANATRLTLHSQQREAHEVIQTLSKETEELHELLWNSDVRTRADAPWGSDGAIDMPASSVSNDLAGRVLALEQQLVLHSRIIRDQQRIIAMYDKEHGDASFSSQRDHSNNETPKAEITATNEKGHADSSASSNRGTTHAELPKSEEKYKREAAVSTDETPVHDRMPPSSKCTPEEYEKLLAERMQKDSIISQMDRAMANYEEQNEKLQTSLKARDMVLSQRQAELSSKDEEIFSLKEAIKQKERQNQWLRSELKRLGHDVILPRDLHDQPASRSAQLPDRNIVARRIAMRNSPGPGSPSSFETSSLSFLTSSLNFASPSRDLSMAGSPQDSPGSPVSLTSTILARLQSIHACLHTLDHGYCRVFMPCR
jgi:hypothetical protein